MAAGAGAGDGFSSLPSGLLSPGVELRGCDCDCGVAFASPRCLCGEEAGVDLGVGLGAEDADCAGVVDEGLGRSGEFEVCEPTLVPDDNARKRASRSRRDGLGAMLFALLDVLDPCSRDRPGTIKAGVSFRRGGAGSAGRLCSSTNARGACVTWVDLLLRCFVGTDSAVFLFVVLKMVFFFLGVSGRGS